MTSNGGGTGTCDDVQGAYAMRDDPGSSQGCGSMSDDCTVTQSGCQLTIVCVASVGTHDVSIDHDERGTFDASIRDWQGTPGNARCTIVWPSSLVAMNIDCQVPVSASSSVHCIADGTKK